METQINRIGRDMDAENEMAFCDCAVLIHYVECNYAHIPHLSLSTIYVNSSIVMRGQNSTADALSSS